MQFEISSGGGCEKVAVEKVPLTRPAVEETTDGKDIAPDDVPGQFHAELPDVRANVVSDVVAPDTSGAGNINQAINCIVVSPDLAVAVVGLIFIQRPENHAERRG